MDNEAMLENSGFAYSPKRILWINRDRRMAFSGEAVADHDSSWVQERLDNTVPEKEFWFWFSGEIPKDFKDTCWSILAEVGLSDRGIQPMAPMVHMTFGR